MQHLHGLGSQDKRALRMESIVRCDSHTHVKTLKGGRLRGLEKKTVRDSVGTAESRVEPRPAAGERAAPSLSSLVVVLRPARRVC